MQEETKQATAELVPQNGLMAPVVPVTTEELAQLDGQRGVEVLKKRMEILALARAGSIARTFPRDWTLFKGEAGTYAYLA
jgi:hypothetical protein